MKVTSINYETMKGLLDEGKTSKEISTIMGIPYGSTPYYIRKLGLQTITTKYLQSRKLHVLMNDSLESFYWAGFLLADGYVTTQTNSSGTYPVIGVELSIKDEAHLQKLSDYLGIKIGYRTKNVFNGTFRMCYLKAIDRTYIQPIMERFDIKLNKTENPPNFTNYTFTREQLLAMFVGFIDGDGSIIRRKKPNGFQSMISIQTKFEWKEWLNGMLQLIKDEFDPKLRVQVRTNVRNHAYLCLTKQSVLENLRQFGIDNHLPILHRKWDNIPSLY